MEIIKSLVPLATFLLGVLATFAFKYYDRRREVVCENVRTLCELAEDWYNRVQTLGRLVFNSLDGKAAEEALMTYSHGSLFLPRFRRSIMVLEKHKKCEAFLDEARAFLSLLTATEEVQLTSHSLLQGRKYFPFEVMHCGRPSIFEDLTEKGKRRIVLSSEFGLPTRASRVLGWMGQATDFPSKEARLNFEATNSAALTRLYARVQKLHLEAAKLLG
jgi:hypothetical protein